MRTVIPKNAVLVPKDADKVFEGIIFDIYQWQQKLFDGSYKTFEMAKRPDTIVVIAIKYDKVIVLDQKQPGTNRYYDFPSGRHDDESETELDAAKRELLEETGLEFANWRLVYAYQRNMRLEQIYYLYIATDLLKQSQPARDPGEDIKILELSYDEALQKINSPISDVLADERMIFEKAGSIQGLLNLPEYKS